MNKARAAARFLPRPAVIGVSSLVAATLLAWVLALAWPSRTDVQITLTPRGAVGQVSGHAGWYIAPPNASLDDPAADQPSLLPWLDQLGEAIQGARPPARWLLA